MLVHCSCSGAVDELLQLRADERHERLGRERRGCGRGRQPSRGRASESGRQVERREAGGGERRSSRRSRCGEAKRSKVDLFVRRHQLVALPCGMVRALTHITRRLHSRVSATFRDVVHSTTFPAFRCSAACRCEVADLQALLACDPFRSYRLTPHQLAAGRERRNELELPRVGTRNAECSAGCTARHARAIGIFHTDRARAEVEGSGRNVRTEVGQDLLVRCCDRKRTDGPEEELGGCIGDAEVRVGRGRRGGPSERWRRLCPIGR